jgi:hypothetical protein
MITSDAISERYCDLATDLVDVFVASQQSVDGVDISAIWIDTCDVTAVESFCFSIYTALVEVLQISTTHLQRCRASMSVYDRNHDDLLDRAECALFVSRLQGGVYVGSEIPLPAIFDDWSNDGTISTVGSKPGSLPTDSERVMLEYLCRQVFVAIAVISRGALPTPALIVFGGPQCFRSIVVSDQTATTFWIQQST